MEIALITGGSMLLGSADVGIGGGSILIAQNLHRRQIAQDVRHFYANYTEEVAHHGEAYSQTERHFSQQYSVEEGQYWVAEKSYRRTFQQQQLQHRVNVEIQMRAMVRENLRDEFAQKNKRFNALMMVQTVVLGTSFNLALVPIPGSDSEATLADIARWRAGELLVAPLLLSSWAARVYAAVLGLSIALLTLSLWCNFLLTRRLNQWTAGMLQVEMHRDPHWRQRAGTCDLTDATMARDLFNNWFKRHCATLASKSYALLACGVVLLFTTVGMILHVRVLNVLKVVGVPHIVWSMVGLTVLSVAALELRERSTMKSKQGAYSQEAFDLFRGPTPEKTPLRESAESLEKFQTDIGFDPQDSFDNSSSAYFWERKSRTRTPTGEDVADTAELVAKTNKTKRVLDMAWRNFHNDDANNPIKGDNEDWKRDDAFYELMAELREQTNERIRVVESNAGSRTSGIRPLDSRENEPGGDRAVAQAASPPSTDLNTIRDAAALEQARRLDVEERSADAGAQQIQVAGSRRLREIRENFGGYWHSTVMHVTNHTPRTLHLKDKKIISGKWPVDMFKPPVYIKPFTQVVFGSHSSRWPSGTAGTVTYDTRDHKWAFDITWRNELFSELADLGRYCESKVIKMSKSGHREDEPDEDEDEDEDEDGDGGRAYDEGYDSSVAASTFSGSSAGGVEDLIYVLGHDDDDQSANNEIYVTITSVETRHHHKRSTAIDGLMQGYLEKQSPSDPTGMLFQRRWFVLHRLGKQWTLSYFASHKNTRSFAKKGTISLASVIEVRVLERSTDFIIIQRRSTREPYMMRAATAEASAEWAEALSACMAPRGGRRR